MNVLPPVRYEDPVVLLSETQKPFGDDPEIAKIPLSALSVLFHYGVRPQDVQVIAKESFFREVDFHLANPVGDNQARRLFKMSIEDNIQGALPLAKVERAFIRINAVDPFAALPPPHVIVPVPVDPPKAVSGGKRKRDAVASVAAAAAAAAGGAQLAAGAVPAAAVDATVPAAGSTAAPTVAPATSVSASGTVKTRIDYSSSSDSDEEIFAAVGPGAGASHEDADGDAESTPKSVSRKSLVNLFSAITNEVCVIREERLIVFIGNRECKS